MYVAREEEVRGGASASTIAREAETPAFENDDPFHDPTVGWVMLVLFLAFLAFSGGVISSFVLQLLIYPIIFAVWKWRREVKPALAAGPER